MRFGSFRLGSFAKLGVVTLLELALVQSALAAPACPIDSVIQVNPQYSVSTIDNAEFSSRFPLVAKLSDLNNDSYAEFMVATDGVLQIRDGKSGAVMDVISYPSGATLTGFGSMNGDYNGDKIDDFFVGFSYSSGSVTDYGLQIYDGQSRQLMVQFPEIIKPATAASGCHYPQDPVYPNPFPANTKGFSATALDGSGTNKATILAGASDASMAVAFNPDVVRNWSPSWMDSSCHQPPYDIADPKLINSYGAAGDSVNRNFGGIVFSLWNHKTNTVARVIATDHNMDYAWPDPANLYGGPILLAGGIYSFVPNAYSSGGYYLTGGYSGFASGHYAYAALNIGDVNDDGIDDFAVSSPEGPYDEHWGGTVDVFSGASLAKLVTIHGNDGDYGTQFGYSIGGAEDMNDDGYKDLVVGVPLLGDAGWVKVYNIKAHGSLKAGQLIYQFEGSTKDARFGQGVVALGAARLLATDAQGRLTFFRLGLDETGAKKKADLLPDRCGAKAASGRWTGSVKKVVDQLRPLVADVGQKMTGLNYAAPEQAGFDYLTQTTNKLSVLSKTVSKLTKLIVRYKSTLKKVSTSLNSSTASQYKSKHSSYQKNYKSYLSAVKSNSSSGKKKYLSKVKTDWKNLNRLNVKIEGYLNRKE